MMSLDEAVRKKVTARTLAQVFLSEYFSGGTISYPINPFQMLTDLTIPFVFLPFDKDCEGIYFPAQAEDDIAVVGINIKRPIFRQRFTAAHELCHHIKDSKNSADQIICEAKPQSNIEKYADSFAAELLMPYTEMKKQIDLRRHGSHLSDDDILEIAEFFGVSFSACLFRAAYVFNAVAGEQDSAALRKRSTKYHADKKRDSKGYNNTLLYEQVINAGERWLSFSPDREFVKYKYCTEYIFNDSRLEGIDLEKNQVAEIVTDIRLHGMGSEYCTEAHEKEIAVAGHSLMYQELFSRVEDSERKVSIFTILDLHKALYACAPNPGYGGKLRTANPLVTGAKFETIDFSKVPNAVYELNHEIASLLESATDITLGEYVKRLAEIHHRLTVIHPFPDGNGRCTRAFLNLLLMKRGVLPIYIKVEEKEEYRSALEKADQTQDYNPLYCVLFKAILRAQSELTKLPML